MHPALRSWRNDLPPNIVRLLAYLGAIAPLSMASTKSDGCHHTGASTGMD